MKKETASLRFLYNTVIGRCVLKLLIRPTISKIIGKYMSSSLSKGRVKKFIKSGNIDMSEFSEQEFKSFNAFFTRKRENLKIEERKNLLISPCDAFLSVYKIKADKTFNIKNSTYSIEQLLDDKEMAERYTDGICFIFRLTPQHYHRYCYSCSGEAVSNKIIKGKLHCVRPIAYTQYPVFAQNSRELVCIDTESFGTVTQMEVGALLVGKIKNHDNSQYAHQGIEKGYFEFGGSTIIVLTEKKDFCIDENFLSIIDTEQEIDICIGDTIATL